MPEWVSPLAQALVWARVSPTTGGATATGAAAISTSITITISIGTTSTTEPITSTTGAGTTSSTTPSTGVMRRTLIGKRPKNLAATTGRQIGPPIARLTVRQRC